MKQEVGGPWPQAVRGLWVWLIPTGIFSLAALAASMSPVLRRAIESPSPWFSAGVPLAGAVSVTVMIVGFWRSLRRIRRAFTASGGRTCTTCLQDLSGLGEMGVCPECGHPFDLAQDRRRWGRVGLGAAAA